MDSWTSNLYHRLLRVAHTCEIAGIETAMVNNISSHSTSLTPKTVFIAEVSPGRHLAEFSIDLANTPGALADASEILSKHNVNVLSGFHDAARWSFFADMTEANVSADQLVHDLKGLKVISAVRLQEAPSGILVDCLHHPSVWGQHRVVMIRAQQVSSILDRVRAIFGEDGAAAKVVLFSMGEAAGHAWFSMIADEVGANAVTKELSNMMYLYSACGWGIFKAIDVDLEQASATVEAIDCFECAPKEGKKSGPYSQFVRGHIAGLFSRLFDRRVDVIETGCIASGNPHCQFRIRPNEGS
jgi:predicted hydrocarbon binding protein